MLITLAHLMTYRLTTVDGELGAPIDFYLDTKAWHVRYLMVDTGSWLPGRKVLLAARHAGVFNHEMHQLETQLSKDQVKNSPDIDANGPVSRQRERDLHQHYGWPFDCTNEKTGLLGEDDTNDPNLRSLNELSRYRVDSRDGVAGNVHSFVAETDNWSICMTAVRTGSWPSARLSLLDIKHLRGLDANDQSMRFEITTESIANAPEYDPSEPFTIGALK